MRNVFNRGKEQTADPGFGTRVSGKAVRLINPDGSFNVKKTSARMGTKHIYMHLVEVSWLIFLVYAVSFIVILNLIFTGLYVLTGSSISGLPEGSGLVRCIYIFYFSIQTFTTVGYGAMSPIGLASGAISSLEAMTGLLVFAIISGLMYGRFSRPKASIKFSKKALMVPHKDGYSLHFRSINPKDNILVNMKANVLLSYIDLEKNLRKYFPLTLETPEIRFFPLNWTIVHTITESSPLYGMTHEMMEESTMEILVLIEGFDDAFTQTVKSQTSYRAEDIEWNRAFGPIYYTDTDGYTVLEIDKLDDTIERKVDVIVSPPQ